MNLRSIEPAMAPETVQRIDVLLDRVVTENAVHVPFAIESGSRAWGFPSPDSDYDCRFFFVRPVEQHLTPWPLRDVIEFPPEGDLDVNGWDLGKALRLMLKGNPGIIDWLSSPIIYRGEGWFREAFLDLAHRAARRDAVGRHHLRFGERQRRSYVPDEATVPLKRILYAVQPAAALRWLRQRPSAAVTPMHFPTLMAECDPPADVRDILADLLARKAVGRGLGEGPVPRPITAFLDLELQLAETTFGTGRVLQDRATVAATNLFYRNVVERLDRPDRASR